MCQRETEDQEGDEAAFGTEENKLEQAAQPAVKLEQHDAEPQADAKSIPFIKPEPALHPSYHDGKAVLLIDSDCSSLSEATPDGPGQEMEPLKVIDLTMDSEPEEDLPAADNLQLQQNGPNDPRALYIEQKLASEDGEQPSAIVREIVHAWGPANATDKPHSGGHMAVPPHAGARRNTPQVTGTASATGRQELRNQTPGIDRREFASAGCKGLSAFQAPTDLSQSSMQRASHAKSFDQTTHDPGPRISQQVQKASNTETTVPDLGGLLSGHLASAQQLSQLVSPYETMPRSAHKRRGAPPSKASGDDSMRAQLHDGGHHKRFRQNLDSMHKDLHLSSAQAAGVEHDIVPYNNSAWDANKQAPPADMALERQVDCGSRVMPQNNRPSTTQGHAGSPPIYEGVVIPQQSAMHAAHSQSPGDAMNPSSSIKSAEQLQMQTQVEKAYQGVLQANLDTFSTFMAFMGSQPR